MNQLPSVPSLVFQTTYVTGLIWPKKAAVTVADTITPFPHLFLACLLLYPWSQISDSVTSTLIPFSAGIF